MAGHHLLGVSSLLVLLIAIASASEYKTPSPVYTPSPVSYTPTSSPKYEAPTPSYKPSPVYTPSYSPSPVYKAPSPKYIPRPVYKAPYTTSPKYKTPVVYTPSPEYKATPYTPSPTYKKPIYTPSPEYKTPTPTPKYDTYKPSPKYETPKSSYCVQQKLSILYGVQGVIYCQNYYYDLTPLVGATAKLSCKSKGYKFSKASPKADKNGYFLVTFTPEELGEYLKPSDCKVYLASSPSKACHIATDIDNGITGALLAHPTTLKGFMKSYILKLYSVAPFVYTSKTHETPSPTYKTPVYTPSQEYKAPVYTPSPKYKAPLYTPSPIYKAPIYIPSPKYTQVGY